MNLQKMISELEAEKARLDEAIVALERLSAGKSKKQRPRHKTVASTETEEETAGPESHAAKAAS